LEFDNHKEICIACKNSIRQPSLHLQRNEIVWCNESSNIEPWYYHCEKFVSKFFEYFHIWEEVF